MLKASLNVNIEPTLVLLLYSICIISFVICYNYMLHCSNTFYHVDHL